MAGAITAHPGRSVVSVELIGPANEKARERLVGALRPHRVEVVITARDLNRSLVALWQETIQNGRTWTWPEYVAGVRAACPPTAGDVPDSGRTFWRQQDLVRIASAWLEIADRVSVVTVPHPGAPRHVLLERFTEAAALPQMVVAEGRGNESLGLASVLALRRMNELLDECDLSYPAGNRLRKMILAKQVLAARRKDEPTLGLSVPDWLVDASATQVERARSLPVDLHGDWADLTPVSVPGGSIDDVEPAQVAEAAIAGMAGLVGHMIREDDEPASG
jgi:hypothetical protein